MSQTRDFWTRRRAAVAAEEEFEEDAERTAGPAEGDATEEARLEGLSDAELLQELDLPEPETLRSGDDFAVFLARAVPDRLRRRALRALWRTNPTLANLDGLVDYNDDYTDSATVVPNLKTAYKVGKGMLAHLERMAQAEPAPEPEPEPEPVATLSGAEEELRPEMSGTEAAAGHVAADDAANDAADDAADDAEVETGAPVPRRMVFTYESDRS